ncbi:MAG: hypothetical protein JWL97_3705 [Gemmatimonadales bacterium]|nr:hypothetical protein [Gemmatimonadales bacterium]
MEYWSYGRRRTGEGRRPYDLPDGDGRALPRRIPRPMGCGRSRPGVRPVPGRTEQGHAPRLARPAFLRSQPPFPVGLLGKPRAQVGAVAHCGPCSLASSSDLGLLIEAASGDEPRMGAERDGLGRLMCALSAYLWPVTECLPSSQA